MLQMNAALRLILLAVACFAATVLLMLVFTTLINSTADCYQLNTCQQTPILGTIAYILDACRQLSYFAIFPIGTVFGRRDFRKLFPYRLTRRIARLTFAAIPVILLPLRYYIAISFF